MALDGFIMLPREVLRAVSADPNALAVLCAVIDACRLSDGFNVKHGYEVKRGECDLTQEQLAAATGLTRHQVRTAIAHLERAGIVAVAPTGAPLDRQRRNVTTLVKPDTYIGGLNRERQWNAKTNAKKPPRGGQQMANGAPILGDWETSRPETGDKDSCVAASSKPAPPEVPEILKDLPLFAASERLCREWESLRAGWIKAYPGINHKQELYKAHSWQMEKPENRKTPKGQARFIGSWFARAQNSAAKPPVFGPKPASIRNNLPTDAEYAAAAANLKDNTK